MEQWMEVDPRWENQKGPILDIGCHLWDWSAQFADRRHVIGVDPIEKTCPTWATLIRAAVSIGPGTIRLSDGGGMDNSVVYGTGGTVVPAVSFQELLLHKPALVKMNVEGAEYPLLMSVSHPIADQLIVSFHDTEWLSTSAYSPHATSALLGYLSNWYTTKCIFHYCKWFQFLRK